jgi:hypothetical protein
MVIIDDFSSGIQRLSMREILKFFLGIDQLGQVVITTQDYSFLESELVRRDSVRLAIKDEFGVSTIENLALKDVHKNLSLRKYLSTNNKFGQLPEIKPEVTEKAIELFNQINDADIEGEFKPEYKAIINEIEDKIN